MNLPTVSLVGIRSASHLVHRACKAIRTQALEKIPADHHQHPPPESVTIWEAALRAQADLRERTLRNTRARFTLEDTIGIVSEYVDVTWS